MGNPVEGGIVGAGVIRGTTRKQSTQSTNLVSKGLTETEATMREPIWV